MAFIIEHINRLMVSLIYCLTFLLLFKLTNMFLYFVTPDSINIDIQTRPLFTVSDKFLSFGLDTKEIINGVDKLPLNSIRLQNLTKLLGPAHFRLGGTMSDRLIFTEIEDSIYPEMIHQDKGLPLFIMTGKDWVIINMFAYEVNARLLFDFNALLRNRNDWDSSNARKLLEFTYKLNLQDNIDWQLGNEPNSFPHVFNITIPATQLSKDFVQLKNLLKILAPTSSLVGPDTTRPQPNRPSCVKYMKDFLMGFSAMLTNASNYLDAIAWHQYYLNGHISTLDDFWNPDTLNLLKLQIDTMEENIKNYQDNLPMWLTETSSAYGGGASGLSNSFAASPLWLDKLGIAASNNISVVVRQSLIGGNYSLISKNLKPLPDWWISILYKKLVGTKVLKCKVRSSRYHRFYCHCSREQSFDNGQAVTVFGINLSKNEISFQLRGTALTKKYIVDEYILTSPRNNRTSQDILLNGDILNYENELPKMIPKKLMNVDNIKMPGFSLGFWIIHNINMKACI